MSRQVELMAAKWRESLALPTAGGTAQALKSEGFQIFPASLPSTRWFRDLYRIFDCISNALDKSPELILAWDEAVTAWLASADNRDFYCSAPPSFRNKSQRDGKRDKIYIQYIAEAFESKLFLKYANVLPDLRHLKILLDELNIAFTSIFGYAAASLRYLDGISPDTFTGQRTYPPIVIKILRYNQNLNRFGTGPHFDKSALSIIAHSDDPTPTVRLCANKGDKLKYSDLIMPFNYPVSDVDKNATVLILGSIFAALGFNGYPPTPHSVTPVRSRVRHSVVAFMLVPHTDTSAISAKAVFDNDLFPNIT